MTERDDRWIQTYSGKAFWPLDPRPGDVDILDIAHGLSNLCRFNGHCDAFYSVAQHSVLVSRHVSVQRLEALLHDAAEAYLGDIVAPIKRHLGVGCHEDRIERAIASAFALDWPWRDPIKRADQEALATELRDLMGGQRGGLWIHLPEAWPERIDPWSPDEAKARFLDRFGELAT